MELGSYAHNLQIMYPRRFIIREKDLCHVFFRCHDKRFFLAPKPIKDALLLLLAKNKHRYEIDIFEFIVMDNHCHLLVRASSAENLGNFMRTVNSQLARIINSHFDRDSQAIRERYKSPTISNSTYLKRAMQYIWLNRYRENRQSRPEKDPYCSVYWRIERPHKFHLNPQNKREERESLLSQLLDSYDKLCLPVDGIDAERSLIFSWLREAYKDAEYLQEDIYENGHTIGDVVTVRFRGELLSAFKRITRLRNADG